MPGLIRKLLIFAAVDGLVLQPSPPRNHPPSTQQAIKIDYNGNIKPLLKDRREEDTASITLESHGIIGLLKVATSLFLISISDREQVALIKGKAIYKITDVALIPLASQTDAQRAITSAREHLLRHSKKQANEEEDTDSSSEDDETLSATDSVVDTAHETPSGDNTNIGTPERRTSVAEDVIHKKGMYGRFAQRWFSKRGWSSESRRLQGLSSQEDLAVVDKPKNVESTVPNEPYRKAPVTDDINNSNESLAPESTDPKSIPDALGGTKDSTTVALLPKILRTTKLYFGTGNFFFSYDYDISHSIAEQHSQSSLPLYLRCDPLYFWNKHIISPFIDAGQQCFVLPVIQGFVGQRSFSVKSVHSRSNSVMIDPSSTSDDVQLQPWHSGNPDEENPASSLPDDRNPAQEDNEKDFVLTLISRRSTKRAGLRYLRRGVDEEGNAANSVETEQILSSSTWDSDADRVSSFTQYRGSIPLFFSQTPYSMKPQVVTWGTQETNARAFKRHFSELSSRYGSIYSVSLVDKHGTEAKIGELYERHAKDLIEHGGLPGGGPKLSFQWFDFHNICRGMRFENVSKLMDSLGPFLKSASWSEISNNGIERKQSGVLRTNCMDCLDRTNVVQSACARTILEAQISERGFGIDLQHDPSTNWFNTLWADNGDAISRQYAGTAALKGDYTRTRKRQITGALTDFGLTLTRYYNNIVNDYFAQAVIDYVLGRATDTIFAEFEADMKTADYFIDMKKVRESAIERCAGIVIEERDEDLVSGWTLSVPTSPNSLKTATFEEAVLLLTEKALYFCRLDWGTEKVREFERIGLEQVDGIVRGVYITSTLAQRHMDAEKNVGFIIHFKSDRGGELVRRNTRSLDSRKKSDQSKSDDSGRFLAFKALPPQSSVTSADSNDIGASDKEMDLVKSMCDEIVKAVNQARRHTSSEWGSPGLQSAEDTQTTKGDKNAPELRVEEKDIISLADAKKSTGYLEQLGYSLKKLVWA